MLFNSPTFIVLFLAILLIYYWGGLTWQRLILVSDPLHFKLLTGSNPLNPSDFPYDEIHYRKVLNEMSKVCAGKIPYYDLTADFKDEKGFIESGYHLNQVGCQLKAEKILEFI